jgi:hypothetical protein
MNPSKTVERIKPSFIFSKIDGWALLIWRLDGGLFLGRIILAGMVVCVAILLLYTK